MRRRSLSVGRPFRLPVPPCPRHARFHIPLVEPDMRISRIRLSDKVSCFCPWEVVGAGSPSDQSKRPIQVFVGEPRDSLPSHLLLVAHPPAEPISSVCLDRAVGLAHRSETEVARPASQQAVEAHDSIVAASISHRDDVISWIVPPMRAILFFAGRVPM